MKKTNQKAKKRNRAKKNAAAKGAERNQKKISTNINTSKPVGKVKAKSEIPKRIQEKRINRGEQKKGPRYYIAKSIQFLRESRTELKKVKWPNRKELLASTAVVILLVLIVALFLGIVDFGLIKAIKNIIG